MVAMYPGALVSQRERRIEIALDAGRWTGYARIVPTSLRVPRLSGLARYIAGAVALAGIACGGNGQTYPHPPDCHVDLLLAPPRDDYVELGEISFEAYAAGPSRYQYRDPYQLLADAHMQICSLGGDTLVAERNALGVIVHATVYRRANASDIPPASRSPPPRTEGCEGACGPGSVCARDECVPACDPACGPGERCGADRQCHAGEVPSPPR